MLVSKLSRKLAVVRSERFTRVSIRTKLLKTKLTVVKKKKTGEMFAAKCVSFRFESGLKKLTKLLNMERKKSVLTRI